MAWQNMMLLLDDYLWCRRSIHYFLAYYEEEKKSTDALAVPAILNTQASRLVILELFLFSKKNLIACAVLIN